MRSKPRNKFGVIPLTVYTRPAACGGACIYCPAAENFPKSYTKNEDTTKAFESAYDPVKQFEDQWLKASTLNNLQAGAYPVELIVLGGSFSAHTNGYRLRFISEISDWVRMAIKTACTSPVPLISVLTVESRPDQITDSECRFLLQLGVSKVEIGVQHTNDSVLASINRGHTQLEVIQATYRLKNYGFKVGYHVMLGLPSATLEMDVQMLHSDLWQTAYNPDYIKIYPCNLLSDTTLQPQLWKMYRAGRWKPLKRGDLVDLLSKAARYIPRYVRVSRIQRQFLDSEIEESIGSGLHQVVRSCFSDISKREGYNWLGETPCPISEIALEIYTYGSDVYFELLHKSVDRLAAIARLRIRSDSVKILREIKVFGCCASLGTSGPLQGNGLGKLLLAHVESYVCRISDTTASILLVNAAPGAKPFFTSQGYSLETSGLLWKSVGKQTSDQI